MLNQSYKIGRVALNLAEVIQERIQFLYLFFSVET